MIISASRRTDIPAFYAEWFINRIRAGYCGVPNPFNRKQISYVSLHPETVDVIVFWTRNPRPLLPYLDELDQHGYRYYFQYTLMDNPRALDPKSPSRDAAISTFKLLANKVGPEKVIWRYDPIMFSEKTSSDFHLQAYRQIAAALQGSTQRSVISIMDMYPKAAGRLRKVASTGYPLSIGNELACQIDRLVPGLVDIAKDANIEVVSCAEEYDLTSYGVKPGKCVDNDYIQKVFGLTVVHKKDPSQRKECGCVVSKDIGMYDTCLFGCQYCYATRSFELAQRQHAEHNSASPSVAGWYEPALPPSNPNSRQARNDQMSLWDRHHSPDEQDDNDQQ